MEAVMSRSIAVFALALPLGLAVAQMAKAQTEPVAPQSKGAIPEKDPSAEGKLSPAPSKQRRPIEGRSSSLSDKLSKSNGVITPPAGVDPGIQTDAPAPNPNSMPVIRPPTAGSGAAKAK
jgi:hypothetical protein